MNFEPPKIIGKWDYAPELIPKNTYTPAQGRATAKWRDKNREYYNTYQREKHAYKMRTDLDYRNMKAEACIKSNARRKIRVDADKQRLKELLEKESS
jgi:hypothetical protein